MSIAGLFYYEGKLEIIVQILGDMTEILGNEFVDPGVTYKVQRCAISMVVQITIQYQYVFGSGRVVFDPCDEVPNIPLGNKVIELLANLQN